MLLSELNKTMVNKITLLSFMGAIAPLDLPSSRDDMNHICLIRLVALKRPGVQSQKYGMPTFFSQYCC